VTDNRPIVVGGSYRSGTSLVRWILDSHPRIHCGPELKFFRDFRSDYLNAKDPVAHLRFMNTARSLLPEDELVEVFGAALVEVHRRAARNAGRPRWADKAPENVVFLSEWQRLLGDDWIFLHVVRNPLDTLASIHEAVFPKLIPADLDARIDLYVEYARAGLAFAEKNPDRYRQVRYENLVSEPEETVRELMGSLGERFLPRQLEIDPTRHQPGLVDPKITRTERIHADGIERWRRVLEPAAVERIVRRTERVWSRLGGLPD
jgi:Sulfotransferase family